MRKNFLKVVTMILGVITILMAIVSCNNFNGDTKDEVYTIQYRCDMLPVDENGVPQPIPDGTYRSSATKALYIPKMDTYKFLGWSDKDGKMYGFEIPKGTTGDLVLYANWASNRNLAIPAKTIGDPIICEDSEAGQIIFIYEIGKITNIPLFETQDLLVVNGIITSQGTVKQNSITKSNAEEIGKVIANTTTNSSSWRFSSDWNNIISVSTEWAEQQGMTLEEAEAFCKNNSNEYNIVNSSGGSSSFVQSDNSYYRVTGNQSHSDSTYSDEQRYAGFNINGKYSNTTTLSAGISAGLTMPVGPAVGNVKAEANASNTSAFEIGASYDQQKYTQNIKTGTNSWSNSVDISNTSSQTSTSSKTWNSSEGFSSSNSTSSSESVSKAISELISQKNAQDSSYTTGGENGQSQDYAHSNANEDKYSSTVTYSNAQVEILERTFESTGNTIGNYRLVLTGTARVFAVVAYDIAKGAYYTYTYSVLDDDEYKEYLDYSYDRSFNDYETSTLPFEIPIFVNDYVDSRIASSKLQISDDGIVTKYLGSPDEQVVLIPSYYTRTNHTTGETETIKVRGIAEGLFKGNTNIIGVSLGNFINEIPAYAFEGCTSLKEVICPNVVRIGQNAFKGCVSLSEFTLPNEIEYIGEYAFDGISAIKVNAPTLEIAKAVASSNVKNITLDISRIENTNFGGTKFNIGSEIETFKLLGGYREYQGLSIKSDAQTTILSGITMYASDIVPVWVSSKNLTLERVKLIGHDFALVMQADETVLSIEGVSTILSEKQNAVIAKNVTFVEINEQTTSYIITTDSNTEKNYRVLICGSINNNDGYLDEKNVVKISENEYSNYLSSKKITFNANGGTVSKTEMTVPYESEIGELPIPYLDNFTFMGWFTKASGGEEITADSVVTADMTLYAQWASNVYIVSFDPNGGSVSPSSNKVTYGATYGTLPTPTRTGYQFLGWYTSATDGSVVNASTTVTASSNHTIYARWEAIAYQVSWSTAANATITVSRTSSPYVGATTGKLSSGAKIYYGDVLSITYTANTGYSISSKGSTSITVTRNITSSDIYASAKANSYTYNIVYKSSNGTALGSEQVTFAYGSTNTITPKTFTGYDTPTSQSVAWNSTTAKTITFTYTPTVVSTITLKENAWWWKNSSTSGIKYTVKVEFTNRTANSVTAKITWTNTITKAYYGFGQYFNMTIGGVSTGKQTIATSSKWPAGDGNKSYNGSATKTVEIVITGLSATTTSLTYSVAPSAQSTGDHPDNFSGTITIPAY